MTPLQGIADLLLSDTSLWSRTGLDVRTKSDDSPVSTVDLVLNNVIRESLLSAWPGIWIVSEEEPSTFAVPDGRDVAIVDPLDGTENYVSGLPIWGISVAVWIGGRHDSSLLAFPELGMSLSTGECAPMFKSRITGHPSSSPLAGLAQHGTGPENRILGSAAFNLFCVATGRFASFSNRTGAHAWDILGGLNLARERGCEVRVEHREYGGEFLDPRRRYRFEVRR